MQYTKKKKNRSAWKQRLYKLMVYFCHYLESKLDHSENRKSHFILRLV